MDVNADFSQRAVVHAGQMKWISSPIAGIERLMLDRIGDEIARATSLVRYAPRRHFSHHVHGGGEEFLVLEGVFQDESGDFPTGSYVRNPPGSAHAPWSDDGCVILVKLWQFDPDDRAHVWIRTADRPPRITTDIPHVSTIPLHLDKNEEVRIEFWAPSAELPARCHPGGLELFVISGNFKDAETTFGKYSWLRLPPNAPMKATAGSDGARVWVKHGHLANPQHRPAAARHSAESR